MGGGRGGVTILARIGVHVFQVVRQHRRVWRGWYGQCRVGV